MESMREEPVHQAFVTTLRRPGTDDLACCSRPREIGQGTMEGLLAAYQRLQAAEL